MSKKKLPIIVSSWFPNSIIILTFNIILVSTSKRSVGSPMSSSSWSRRLVGPPILSCAAGSANSRRGSNKASHEPYTTATSGEKLERGGKNQSFSSSSSSSLSFSCSPCGRVVIFDMLCHCEPIVCSVCVYPLFYCDRSDY